MVCKYCGTENSESKFCSGCGKLMNESLQNQVNQNQNMGYNNPNMGYNNQSQMNQNQNMDYNNPNMGYNNQSQMNQNQNMGYNNQNQNMGYNNQNSYPNNNGQLSNNNTRVNNDAKKWAILSVVLPAIGIIMYFFVGLPVYIGVLIAAYGWKLADKGKSYNSQLALVGKILSGILMGLAIVIYIILLLGILILN